MGFSGVRAQQGHDSLFFGKKREFRSPIWGRKNVKNRHFSGKSQKNPLRFCHIFFDFFPKNRFFWRFFLEKRNLIF